MTPTWLTDFLAASMLAVAAYCASRLVVAGRLGGGTEFDIDGAHVVMGVAMAGMLLSRLSFLSSRVWEVLFAIGAAWFAVRAATALRQPGAGRMGAAHRVQYAIACGAMLYMYLAPVAGGGAGSVTSGGSGMPGMAGATGATGATGAADRYPTIGLVLALVLVGYAVMTTDRTTLTTVGSSAGGGGEGGGGTGAGHGPLAPRAANCCHIAMSVTMAYMLITLL